MDAPKCSQCDKPAFVQVGGHNLCVDHWNTVAEIQARDFDQDVALFNMFQARLAETIPIYRPQFIKLPQPVTQNIRGPLMVNNLGIENSVIGMLNTGQIRDVSSISINIDSLERSGQQDAANALKALTKAITLNQDLSAEQKSDLLQQVGEVTRQAALPAEQRSPAVLRVVVGSMQQALMTVAALAEIWNAWGSTILTAVGLK